MAKRKIKVTPSSGNVFADLGFRRAGTELTKADLAARIAAIIEERGLSQTQAARTLGVDQPKVSDLVRGKLKAFSVERLFRFLNSLGCDIEIAVRPKRPSGRAAIRVIGERKRSITHA